jgi:hypothetical protein
MPKCPPMPSAALLRKRGRYVRKLLSTGFVLGLLIGDH